jgi:hypothetical protein
MITTILIWIYIFFVSTTWGLFVFKVINKTNPNENISIPVYLLSIVGLATICCFLSIFSIFYKIDLIANLIVVLTSIIIYFVYRKDLLRSLKRINLNSISLFSLVVLGLAFLIILIETVSSVKIYDTGLYHAQAIQWINKYGVIPGLGNLHQRFAFNNQNFILEALFSLRFLKIQPFHVLNGYVSILFTLTIIQYFLSDLKEKKVLAFLYLILLSVPLFFFRKYISSPSPDIMVALVTTIIFLIYYNFKENFTIVYWSIFILSCFLITIKISSLPVIILPVLCLLENYKKTNKNFWLSSLSIGLLFLIPYVIRNVMISGYLLYPFSQLDFFNFDWKIPKEYVDQMNMIIKGWARTKEWVTDKSFLEWFPIWFNKLTIFNKLSLVISIFGPFIILISDLSSKYFKMIRKEDRILSVVLLSFTFFWLFSAPDLRFIFHIQVFTYALITVILLRSLNKTRININQVMVQKVTYSYGLPIVLILFSIFTFSQSFSLASFSKYAFTQASYPAPKIVHISVNSVPLNSPADNELCWDACLPCTIIQDKIGVSPLILKRDSTIEAGYHTFKK